MIRALLLSCVLGGCTYPEFAFAPDADAEPDTQETIEPTEDVMPDVTRALETEDRAEPSCKAIKAKLGTEKSGAFAIDPDGDGPLTPFSVFCEMNADGGGWTLALKADGAKITFAYDAALWTNDEVLNPASTDLSTAEAKFRAFSELPFTQIRVRMFDGTTPRFFVLNHGGSSLRALFAGGPVTTMAGRAKWLTLLADPSLQENCNAEGINQQFVGGNALRIRLGIAGNNETHCDTVNSYIGLGATMGDAVPCFGGVDPGVVVGNAARTACAAPKDKSTHTAGFLFVR